MEVNNRIIIVVNQDINIFHFRIELIKNFVSKGYEVTICCPKTSRTNEFESLGCSFVDTSLKARGKNPFSDIYYYLQLKKIFAQINPFVIFTFTIKPNIYATLAASRLNIPSCPNITGLGDALEKIGIVKKIALQLSKQSFKKATYVFFQNKQNMEYYQSMGIVKDDQSILIPGSGVNLVKHCLEEYPSENNGLKILFVGRLLVDKGIKEFIETANHFRGNKNISFSCLGSIDNSTEEIINSLKTSNIKYLGYQSDVHSVIKEHHVVVLPSYHEGMANVLLESAATGRPIIASLIPGCQETFDDGISGIGCAPRSVNSLYDSILRFSELGEEEHRKMGLKGRSKVERYFSRDIVIDKYNHIVKNIEKDNNLRIFTYNKEYRYVES